MDEMMGGFGAHFLALLIGGLGGSLGLTFGARTQRAQAVLAPRSPAQVWIIGAVVAIGGAGAAWWIGSRFADAVPSGFAGVAPAWAFAFGLSVGVPISVPGVIAAWIEARRRAGERARKRDFVPTKDDRRAYAEQIARQIEEVSPSPRAVKASITGDGGTVLLLEGNIDAAEGDRLTAALRADLAEVGFKRVEGRNGKKEWWSRV